MKPTTYYQSLSVPEKIEYALRAGTTIRHMQSMFTPAGFRKRPRDRLIVGIVEASNGAISLDEAIDYFLVAPVRKLAAELAAPSPAIPAVDEFEMPEVKLVQLEWAVLPMDGGVGL